MEGGSSVCVSSLILEEKKVPPAIVKAFQDALEQTPPRLLFDFARIHPALMKGLSPRPDSLPILRRRIQNLIATSRHLSPELHDLLQESSLQSQLLIVLSHTAIESAFEPLAIFYGEANLLAGLLLDKRESLRSLAWRHLDAHPDANGFAGRDPLQAKRVLADTFSPFLACIAPLLPADTPRPPPDEKTTAALAQLKHDLQKEQTSRKQAERERDRSHKDREEYARRIAFLEEQLKQQRLLTQHAQAETLAATRELSDLRAELNRRIQEGIAAEWTAESARWLRPLQMMETATQNNGRIPSLINEARAVLQEQAERDRVGKTRRAIRERLEEMEELLHAISEARRESLNPHPRLPEMEAKLQTEIHRLQELLGEPPRIGETEHALLARINEAPNLDTLRQIIDWIEGPATAWELFSLHTRNRLLARASDKHHELMARTGILETRNTETAAPQDPLRRFLAIPQGLSCLFIDGHNFLLAKPLPGESTPSADTTTRDRFARLLAAAAEPSPHIRIRLYFDGPVRSEHHLTEKLILIYSGGGAANQRADEAILADLAFYRDKVDHCLLITEDHELKEKAAALGVRWRAHNLLSALLHSLPIP